MAENDSIFEFNDKFSLTGPFDDWLSEQKLKTEINKINRQQRQKKIDYESDSFRLRSDLMKESEIERSVFLTFDDGLQPGTEEVLKVLDALKVKATFFLTGIHIRSFIEKIDKGLGLSMLREIFLKHQIGNHSYSHANDYYENYYSDGLKIGKTDDGKFIYRSVIDDFKRNDELINYYLKEAGVNVPLGKQYQIARFPGRNSWYDEVIKDLDSDTKEEAKDLFDAGYKIYGWDTEWNMNFQVVNIAKAKIQSKEDEQKLDWTDEEHTHPFFDLYSDELIDKDRVNESVSDVKDDIEDLVNFSVQPFDDVSKKLGKVILLMHERAFRYKKNKDTSEAHKLANLIINLKRTGFKFKTMKEY